MPGPHLTFRVMQCWPDIGGVDCWIGQSWSASDQWWVGYHLPGPEDLTTWSWEGPHDRRWLLIGWERWQYCSKKPRERLVEAQDVYPNPSIDGVSHHQPNGHYHVLYHSNGNLLSVDWKDDILGDGGNLYLKGGSKGDPKGGGKGKGQAKGNDKGKGKGKGGAKGKGKGGGKTGKA